MVPSHQGNSLLAFGISAVTWPVFGVDGDEADDLAVEFSLWLLTEAVDPEVFELAVLIICLTLI